MTGLILNSWIPVYYDTPRQLEIVGKDNQRRSVVVHAGMQEQVSPALLQGVKDPQKDVIDLAVGRYDITVKMGTSYQSQREQTDEKLSQMITAAPELMLRWPVTCGPRAGTPQWVSKLLTGCASRFPNSLKNRTANSPSRPKSRRRWRRSANSMPP